MTRRPLTTEIRIYLQTILSVCVLAVLVLACAGAVDAASAEDAIEVRSGMV